MTPALLAAFELVDPSLVPDDLMTALREHCGQFDRHSDALATELLGLVADLVREGVTLVPFKGPPMAEFLFGDAAARPPGDLDILAYPKDVSRVCAVLTARGFVDADAPAGAPPLTAAQHVAYRRTQCEYKFVRPSDDMIVEPHWDLSQRALSIDIGYGDMLARARTIGFRGRELLMLAPDDLLLALCIHGAKHQWERLAWIRDLAALLVNRGPDIDLEAVTARASRAGCARLFLMSLSVVRQCAGVAFPAAIDRQMASDPGVAALEARVMARLFDPRATQPLAGRLDRFFFTMRERPIDRLRYVTRVITTPRRTHIQLLALPPILHWAYVPMKIVIDYVAAPLWRAVQFVPGVRRTVKRA